MKKTTKTIEMSWDNFESIIASWLYAVRAIPEGKEIEISSVSFPEDGTVKIRYNNKPAQLELPLE